jgi:hypothetical protein
MGATAKFSIRGVSGPGRSVRRTAEVKRTAMVGALPPGRYRVAAKPIRAGGKKSLPNPASSTVRVRRSGVGPTVAAHYDTCSQKTVKFNRIMAPSCGALWGAVANAFSARPGWPAQGPDSQRRYERAIGRTFGVYGYYYSPFTDPPFPRPSDIAFLREPGKNRMLLAHWRIAQGLTFADVLAGKADGIIDRQAAHLKASFPEKIFVSLQSEAEWQVASTADPGRSAKEYAAMYRYVVDRMRSQGVDNVIWVLVFGGYAKWATQPWFADLYPGDSAVDWIAWNPYSYTLPHGPDFGQLLNSTEGSTNPSYRGMYNYLTRTHPGKPLMLSELGIAHDRRNPDARLSLKAGFYDSLGAQLRRFPALRAIVNFDAHTDVWTGRDYDIGVLSNRANKKSFRRVSQLPVLVNPVR